MKKSVSQSLTDVILYSQKRDRFKNTTLWTFNHKNETKVQLGYILIYYNTCHIYKSSLLNALSTNKTRFCIFYIKYFIKKIYIRKSAKLNTCVFHIVYQFCILYITCPKYLHDTETIAKLTKCDEKVMPRGVAFDWL